MYGLAYNPYGLIETADSLITGPVIEPLDIDEVKKQRRFTPTTLDTLFDLWISASRQTFEEETSRQLITATWEYWLAGFPWQRQIELPHPPLQAVESITYDLSDGTSVVLDEDQYKVVAPAGDYCRRGYVELNPGLCWPTAVCQAASVRIRYTAGYGDAPGDVPERFRHALLMLVGHFHKYAEEVQIANADMLSLPFAGQAVLDRAKKTAMAQLPAPSRYPYMWTSWAY